MRLRQMENEAARQENDARERKQREERLLAKLDRIENLLEQLVNQSGANLSTGSYGPKDGQGGG